MHSPDTGPLQAGRALLELASAPREHAEGRARARRSIIALVAVPIAWAASFLKPPRSAMQSEAAPLIETKAVPAAGMEVEL